MTIDIQTIDYVVQKIYGVSAYQKVLPENCCRIFHKWIYSRRACRAIRTCEKCGAIQVIHVETNKWGWSNRSYFHFFEKQLKEAIAHEYESTVTKNSLKEAFIEYLVKALSLRLPSWYNNVDENFASWLEQNLNELLEHCPEEWLKKAL